MDIKQLKQNGQPFVPITAAEAVVVKFRKETKRLDQVLNQKIDTVESDDLTITKTGTVVKIGHTNKVTPVNSPTPVAVSYDEHGHITGSKPVESITVSVNGEDLFSHDGSEKSNLKLGDDFEHNNNDVIGLHWNNI